MRPTVVANLTANLLNDCAAHLDGGNVPGTLVCSGMLESETDDVAASFASTGLREAERRAEGEWAALLLRRDR